MKYLVAIALAVQSLSYSSGQNVSPAYEGWEAGTDGQKYFVFGYMNRNWEEDEIARAVGRLFPSLVRGRHILPARVRQRLRGQ